MEPKIENSYETRAYPTGKRELFFGLGILCCGLLLANMTLFGGFNLGFAIAGIGCIVCIGAYLLFSGYRLTGYSAALLSLSVVILASFARSDDGFVKFVMVCFLTVSVSLGLCLLGGKNRRSPNTAGSLADVGFTWFTLGFEEMGAAGHGLKSGFRRSGSIGQKGGAVLLGLGIAIPVLLIIVPLLVSADAAFEGLVGKLPDFSFGELIGTAVVGGVIAFILYTLGTALNHYTEAGRPEPKVRKGLSPLTINTVLGVVCFVYGVYLASQLAYFTGGFAGILPEEYTLAQYARRGFFEMAALCAINLSVIVFSLWICEKKAPTPVSTRMFSLFIGIITLFFVVAASAKMILYIDSYGLTRLRVLTQVIMVFMGIVTALVCVWLFVPRLPYMKAVILTALVIGAAVSWIDVDTQVARYNVNAYLDGQMDTVDVSYLNKLGDGVVPYLVRLAEEAPDTDVAGRARTLLENRGVDGPDDFRDWNYVKAVAGEYVREFSEDTEGEKAE